jgi:hypothetical protein
VLGPDPRWPPTTDNLALVRPGSYMTFCVNRVNFA